MLQINIGHFQVLADHDDDHDGADQMITVYLPVAYNAIKAFNR